MDKEQLQRLALFAVFSMAIFATWNYFFPPPPRQPPPVPAQSAPVDSTPAEVPGVATAPATVAALATPVAPVAPTVAATETQQFTLKSGLSIVVFSNQGAMVHSWQIDGVVENRIAPVELVRPPPIGRPLKLFGEPAALVKKLNDALWLCSATDSTIQCDYADAEITARKRLTLHENYLHELDFSASRAGVPVALELGWGAGFGPELSDADRKNQFTKIVKINGLIQGDKRTKAISLKKEEKQQLFPGPFVWYGLDDNFYGALFVPATPMAALTIRDELYINALGADGKPRQEPNEHLNDVHAPFTSGHLFVGPKKHDDLKALGHALESAAGFEHWAPLVTPATLGLYHSLRWLQRFTVNWGMALIVLTLLFRILMLPLVFNSSVNMRVTQVKMQRIQKKVEDIRAKYKKQGMAGMAAMQEEIGVLYKKHGISQFSMMAGCLPLLLQMPLFFGFFHLLSRVLELKNQPFLHIPDLTSFDPWLITPILAGVFQFVAAWMSSKTITDKGQRIMMLVLPLIFSFFFIYYPAGLSLYWAVSNLFTIGQMKLVNHYGDKKVDDERRREKLKAEITGEK